MLEHAETLRFTYGDYRLWEGDERWELIDGEAFAMSPAPSRRHQKVTGRLYRWISLYLEGHRCDAYIAPFDVRLPDGDEDDDKVATVVQPDLAVICDLEKLDDAGCCGAPDWVVEVLSRSTSTRDKIQKRDLYERHGVGEYWCIDPLEDVALIFRLETETRRFSPPERVMGGTSRPVAFPALEIDWRRVFAA